LQIIENQKSTTNPPFLFEKLFSFRCVPIAKTNPTADHPPPNNPLPNRLLQKPALPYSQTGTPFGITITNPKKMLEHYEVPVYISGRMPQLKMNDKDIYQSMQALTD